MKKSELKAENDDLRRRIVALEKAMREHMQKHVKQDERLRMIEAVLYEEIKVDPVGDLARALTAVVGAAKQRIVND